MQAYLGIGLQLEEQQLHQGAVLHDPADGFAFTP
jgi:hypothetical protein